MKKVALLTTLAAAALLTGCNSAPPATARVEPTYQEAASAPMLQNSREAVLKLTAGFDMAMLSDGGPLLVATVVNVNDLGRSAPLGRTLSE